MTRAAGLPVVAALAALLAGSLAGCSDPPEPRIVRKEGLPAGSTYVALGDSYSAGPRLGPSSGPVGCEQTTGNYPHLLAARLGLELTDVTCGGATSAHLAGPQTPPNGDPVPPQLDALTADTDLVTIGIGGNDGKVFAELVTTCVGLAVEDRRGAPCTAEDAEFRAKVERQLGKLPSRMIEAVEAVRERAPDATVLVVGYPHVFPASGTCDLLPLARGDYPYGRDLVSRINDGLSAAAEQTGVGYVDVWAATEGHDICSADPWIAGLIPERAALEYHPYAEEQKVVADLLAAALR
ncbi:SGNH/GDSL hydrolase family protein [Nocardioides humi]|uniref:SGNH/GDSL hydrolase family protein n=1 Tax=Nocardioides humi TaxID=449461 RepID=A0ABN2A392_9ACTN|nr:SGNH/GDSL hydrolase family protein [Nocardioides humi]